MNKQMSMSFVQDELAEVKTNKTSFLAQMDRLVPWGEWVKKIERYYYKGERGNKSYELELMLRIHVLQNSYNLADMAVMTEVIDSRAFSRFCGVESSNQIPDGDTIGRFRNIPTKNGLQKQLFADLVETLKKNGLIVMKGPIVDSTLIAAAPSTKDKEKQRAPEAHQSKKGNNWHFGYKAHIGTDRDTGLVHHVEVTAGNVSDVAETSQLLNGTEDEVYGDSGYAGAEKREEAIRTNDKGKAKSVQDQQAAKQHSEKRLEMRSAKAVGEREIVREGVG